jgi:hypothetical protein
MRFRLSFCFDIGNGGSVSMTDWARDAAKHLRDQQEKSRLEQQAFVEKQQLKRVKGPQMWGALKERIVENCKAFNVEVEREVLVLEKSPNDRMVVKSLLNDAPRTLRISFDEAAGSLGYGCEGRFEKWQLEVSNSGVVQFSNQFGSDSVESIADAMLNTLVLR